MEWWENWGIWGEWDRMFEKYWDWNGMVRIIFFDRFCYVGFGWVEKWIENWEKMKLESFWIGDLNEMGRVDEKFFDLHDWKWKFGCEWNDEKMLGFEWNDGKMFGFEENDARIGDWRWFE